ncbi:hypothetical protein QWZ12_20785 [Methylobacterium adhaesivum]|uniref:Uncharacterized protein n=1 Tax=Methylobacterium adhaesivum TaxID=333297 RepID=A0ABT8BMN5_9HYPH|nr:hypothetical protein [Methylobacterium adhaesivum]MDN3593039.1 hypothetical protein [Methylobacterium adhaesivum]
MRQDLGRHSSGEIQDLPGLGAIALLQEDTVLTAGADLFDEPFEAQPGTCRHRDIGRTGFEIRRDAVGAVPEEPRVDAAMDEPLASELGIQSPAEAWGGQGHRPFLVIVESCELRHDPYGGVGAGIDRLRRETVGERQVPELHAVQGRQP